MTKTKFTLLIIFVQTLIIFAQNDEGYAKYLFETKDYFDKTGTP